ncbi:outer membrane lipid asymmetry maintenance protein MlaD [Thalassolituus sp.]|uniref:outer membrane lipid asymmetry maintenance protein MlaD n=1 Tax=Thalassolituus sp. TaxID=2030822 RepID=UPI003515FBC8
MQMRNVELMVGGFMVMGIIALVLMAFRVSGLSMEAGGETYTLKARFENLGGLTERAKVSMSGVTVGKVSRIYLDKEWYMAVVEMEIDSNAMATLSTDTSAAILTAGLLGEKYIGLTVGAEAEYLADGDWIHETQSAIVLEELIGRFFLDKAEG